MTTQQDVVDAWNRALSEEQLDEGCGGYGENPNPPANLDERAQRDRFEWDDTQMLTDKEVADLPDPEENYADAPDF